jgi:hypothetical protein
MLPTAGFIIASVPDILVTRPGLIFILLPTSSLFIVGAPCCPAPARVPFKPPFFSLSYLIFARGGCDLL